MKMNNHMLTYNDFLNEMNISLEISEANIKSSVWTDEEYRELKDLQLDNLKDLITIFEKHKSRFWIDCGTLLGIYRDKNIIDGDSDCDVGIFAEDITLELLNDLEDRLDSKHTGMFYKIEKLKSYINTDEFVKAKNLKFVMLDGKKKRMFKDVDVSCDIFLYFPHEDYHMFKYGVKHYIRTKSQYVATLDSMQFKGLKFKIPSSIEKYLEQLYGKEWSTPDSSFDYKSNKPWCLYEFDKQYYYNFKTNQYKIEE